MATNTTIVIREGVYTVSSTAIGLSDLGFTNSDLLRADSVHISVTAGGDIRYFYGGTTPTASQGHQIQLNSERILQGPVAVQKLKFISESAPSTLSITLSGWL